MRNEPIVFRVKRLIYPVLDSSSAFECYRSNFGWYGKGWFVYQLENGKTLLHCHGARDHQQISAAREYCCADLIVCCHPKIVKQNFKDKCLKDYKNEIVQTFPKPMYPDVSGQCSAWYDYNNRLFACLPYPMHSLAEAQSVIISHYGIRVGYHT
jgi:hypothetical protein